MIALIVLLITFGSLVAAGANMLIALAGVAVGVLGVLGWSSVGDGIQSTTLILAVMLGLAVGIDYTLFILSRFRDELRSGADTATAISRAAGTAGSSVVVAGMTVVIALAGLALVQIPFITEMGLGAAFGVVVAVLISLTAVPAVLMACAARPCRGGSGAWRRPSPTLTAGSPPRCRGGSTRSSAARSCSCWPAPPSSPRWPPRR